MFCLIHLDSWFYFILRHRQKRCQQTRFYAGDFGNFFNSCKIWREFAIFDDFFGFPDVSMMAFDEF